MNVDRKTKFKLFILAILIIGFFGMVESSEAAANYYVRPGAAGSNNGSDWTNAYTSLNTAISNVARGNTIYIAGGSYGAGTFSKAASGTSVMTIKKAVISDHGTDVGWSDAYGTTQATFTDMTFSSNYWLIDGNYAALNPGNLIPSQTATYGIKINFTGTDAWSGIISVSGTSNVTVKGVHSYSQYRAKLGNYTIRNIRAYNASYFSCYNCFLDGSGQDGVVIVGNHFLFDHCFFLDLGERHAHSPDNHGQTIYNAGSNDAVVRWSIFKNCEGQALWASDDGLSNRLRFYGNIVYNSADNNYSGGFNSTGGIMETPTSEVSSGIYVYNNTVVRQPANAPDGSGGNYATYVNYGNVSNNWFVYNNLEYAVSNTGPDGTMAAGYWAVGGGATPSGVSNLQTGLASSIFNNYTSYDFRLTGHTSAGLNLTGQSWWSGGADSFFGTTDSVLDMSGNTRSTWDRGAFEYSAGGGGDTTPPGAPSGLSVQ